MHTELVSAIHDNLMVDEADLLLKAMASDKKLEMVVGFLVWGLVNRRNEKESEKYASEGYEKGYDDGYQEAYRDGYDEGYEDGRTGRVFGKRI